MEGVENPDFGDLALSLLHFPAETRAGLVACVALCATRR